MAKLAKQGHPVAPVIIQGRTIANTFWGRAWCENLEQYGDFANRLPRGRTYVRNGSVLDLQIAPGNVEARVSGSSIYRVRVQVKAVPGPHWRSLCQDCGGAIESLVELLQGRFSQGVMARLCRQGSGLFPAPAEIAFSCSCPDGAAMCKHVAAVLYGVGARLDREPELLFRLRKVDGRELLAHAAAGLTLAAPQPTGDRMLDGDDLAELFGLEMDPAPPAIAKAKAVPSAPKPKSKAKPESAPAQPKATRTRPAGATRPKAAKSEGKGKPKPKGTRRSGTIS